MKIQEGLQRSWRTSKTDARYWENTLAQVIDSDHPATEMLLASSHKFSRVAMHKKARSSP